MCTCLVNSNLNVYVAAVQEIHFTCATDSQVLEDNYAVLSAYGSHSSVGVSLLIGRNLNADVNLVLVDDGDRLVVADVAVKSFEFQVATVYACISLYREFPDSWNTILDTKIHRVGRGARGTGRCESSLIDLMAYHDLVDWFPLDHPGREMWTWLDSSPSVHTRSYLDRGLEEQTPIFFKCRTV